MKIKKSFYCLILGITLPAILFSFNEPIPEDSPGSPEALTPEPVLNLSTKHSRISVDRSNGRILHFIDLASRQEFVDQETKPIFYLRLTKPYENKKTDLTSEDFKHCEIRKSGSRIVMTFSGCDQFDLKAQVNMHVAKDETINMHIGVENNTGWSVALIGFPQMPGPARLGRDDSDDFLLCPWGGGSVIPAPGRQMYARSADYPQIAFAQFYTYYDNTAGLYCGMEDKEGHYKRYQLSCNNRQVSMTVEHLFPEIDGRDAELPYQIMLTTFQGDWHQAAAIYRSWAEQQPWCRTRLSERKDIPQFLKEGSGVIISSVRNQSQRESLLGDQFEKLPDLLDQYRRRTGFKHMIYIPYGWEKDGTWAGIHYLPAFPSNEIWIKTNRELEARDHRLGFMVSGYRWVIKRPRRGSDPAFDNTGSFEQYKHMCTSNPDGSIYFRDHYNDTSSYFSWQGLSAYLCHGSQDANQWLKKTFLNIAEMGIPLISFDQEIGGGAIAPCYDRKHGHPPGYGKWIWTGFRDLCEEILEEGKPVEPELGLFLENVNEMSIPCMATFWSRQFSVVDYQVTGGINIGLFSYLYHDYVTAIGASCGQGQGHWSELPSADMRCYALANNLVRGLIPGPFMQHVPLETENAWEKQVSRAYFSFCQPYAHFPEYLMLGKCCPPPKIDCNDNHLTFWREDEEKGTPLHEGGAPLYEAEISLPAIASGTFEAEDGSRATVCVNTTGTGQEARITIPENKEGSIYSSNRVLERQVKTGAESLSIQLNFKPYDVKILIVN